MARLVKRSDQFDDEGAHKVFLNKISFEQPLWSFASHISKKRCLSAAMAVKPITWPPVPGKPPPGYE